MGELTFNRTQRAMSEAETKEPDKLALAISTAKNFLRKAFEGENIENIELEEIQPPEYDDIWQVTLGFNRRRDLNAARYANNPMGNSFLQAAAAATVRPQRIYKLVKVDLTGHRAISITNRKDD